MRSGLLVLVGVLTLAAPAAAHQPGTAIGQAVLALRDVPVSYENGAAVSELEADAFNRLPGVGDGIYVAAMPASALQEIGGGPDRIAREVAREAELRGTVVVLAGTRLGGWSDEIDRPRLQALAQQASGTPGERVRTLVASVAAEPKTSGQGSSWWPVLAAAAGVAAVAALVVLLARRLRRSKA